MMSWVSWVINPLNLEELSGVKGVGFEGKK